MTSCGLALALMGLIGCAQSAAPCDVDSECAPGFACDVDAHVCVDLGSVQVGDENVFDIDARRGDRDAGVPVLDDDDDRGDAPDAGPDVADAGVDDTAQLVDAGPLPQSCAELHALDPAAESGPHAIEDAQGNVVDVFCDMDTAGGGWTRVVDWSFDPNAALPCPGNLVPKNGAGCGHEQLTQVSNARSASFTPALATYREVRGVVRAFAVGTNDGFDHGRHLDQSLDGFYVDGASLTVGPPGSRVHVWTFASGVSDPFVFGPSHCPCRGGTDAQGFVGDFYSCEEPHVLLGNNAVADVDDDLFDGQQLSSAGSCPTSFESDPDFQRDLGVDVGGPLELRVLGTRADNPDVENVLLHHVELFVR